MPSEEEVTPGTGNVQSLAGHPEADFQALLPDVEQAFVTSMHDRTSDGSPRTSRRSRTSGTCPFPVIADTRLFMLISLQQHPIPEVQGQLFGISQSYANTWIHVLHPMLNRAFADHERLLARTATEFAAMFENARDGREVHHPPFWHNGTNVRSTARRILKSNTSIIVAGGSVLVLREEGL